MDMALHPALTSSEREREEQWHRENSRKTSLRLEAEQRQIDKLGNRIMGAGVPISALFMCALLVQFFGPAKTVNEKPPGNGVSISSSQENSHATKDIIAGNILPEIKKLSENAKQRHLSQIPEAVDGLDLKPAGETLAGNPEMDNDVEMPGIYTLKGQRL